uniref:Fibronectin type-III domain-containing protein n=1 Tax=Panagrolaimus sp. ES5 TaxID=591445 RepID=A0AC34G5U7_9BILA
MPPSPPRPQSVTMLSDDPPLRARIDWQPPEITYNQPINAYTVYYRPIDSLASEGYEKLEVPGTQLFAELTKLYMGKEYEIFVSAGNDDGWSSNATEKLTTSIGVPDGEPLNVRYDISAGQVKFFKKKLTTSIGVPDGEPLNVRYDISAGQTAKKIYLKL